MKRLVCSIFVSAILTATLTSCSSQPKEPPKEYKMQGEILRLDPNGQLATVKHGKIEGWMEPMTMDYPVKDKQVFEGLKVGENIDAKVLVQGTDYWLSEVKPDTATPVKPAPDAQPSTNPPDKK
jgi:Cu/Ag efflux protein CusF